MIFRTKFTLSGFQNFITEVKATVLPITALALPVIFGMVGLGIDGSLWVADQRNLQSAADAGVLAAGWELAQEYPDSVDATALREAENNGYQGAALNGNILADYTAQAGGGYLVTLSLEQDAKIFFSQIIFSDPVRIGAYAEAIVDGVVGGFCILALDPTAQGAFSTFGNVGVVSPNCGIAVNSTDPEALELGGVSSVDIDTVRVAGDYTEGGNVSFNYNSLKTGTSPIEDPYEDLEIPPYNCVGGGQTIVNSSTTLSPGTFCGGLRITGTNDIVFEPGVYIIHGGDFTVTGSGTLYGDGVTFILTGNGNNYAQVSIAGDRAIELIAPPAGSEYEGVVFFQDRDAPYSANQLNKIVGTSDIIIDGVVYFPNQGIRFGGDSSLAGGNEPCTKIIGRTVQLAGNPRIGNSCDNTAAEDIGVPLVHLIR